MIVGNSNLLAIPSVGTQLESPFFVNGYSTLNAIEAKESAFAISIVNMLYAFEHIILGNISWPYILSKGLKLELING